MHVKDSSIQLFQNEQFGNLRVVRGDNGDPWFVAKDVCEALGVATNHLRESGRGLDDDEVASLPNWEGKGSAPTIVSEAGLYSLILRSRKPEAKAFKRWVTHEVLPSIRKSGGYMVAKDGETAEEVMARALKIADETLRRRDKRIASLEAENTEMAPKAFFADAVKASNTSILIGDLAKLLRQNGYPTGQNRLFCQMRDEGYLMKHGSSKNMPTQRSMEMGLFEIKERTVSNPDGTVRITKTPKVTGKGQVYFVNRYCRQGSIDVAEGAIA